jgi:hypothetical protein
MKGMDETMTSMGTASMPPEDTHPEKQEAAWMVFSKEHPDGYFLFAAHLADDEDAPSGQSWYHSVYLFNDNNEWVDVNGGAYWGYDKVDELVMIADQYLPAPIDAPAFNGRFHFSWIELPYSLFEHLIEAPEDTLPLPARTIEEFQITAPGIIKAMLAATVENTPVQQKGQQGRDILPADVSNALVWDIAEWAASHDDIFHKVGRGEDDLLAPDCYIPCRDGQELNVYLLANRVAEKLKSADGAKWVHAQFKALLSDAEGFWVGAPIETPEPDIIEGMEILDILSRVREQHGGQPVGEKAEQAAGTLDAERIDAQAAVQESGAQRKAAQAR